MGKSAPKERTTQDRQRIQAGLIEPRAGPASASDDPRQEASNQSLTAGRTCAYRSVSRGAIIEDNRSSTALELAIIHWMAHSPLLYYSTALFLAATRPRIGMAGFEPAISCSRSRRINQAILHPVPKCPAGVEPALPPWQGSRLPLQHGHR